MVSTSLSSNDGSGGITITAPISTYTDRFKELFPYYISIGMTEEQYWDRDVTLVIDYRKAEELRQERTNLEAWLQGKYVYDAFCLVSPILHAFAKKGTKPMPYHKEPLTVTARQAEEKQIENAKKSYDKGKCFMERFLVNTNQKFEKTEE